MKNLPRVLMIFRSGALRPEKQQVKKTSAADLDYPVPPRGKGAQPSSAGAGMTFNFNFAESQREPDLRRSISRALAVAVSGRTSSRQRQWGQVLRLQGWQASPAAKD